MKKRKKIERERGEGVRERERERDRVRERERDKDKLLLICTFFGSVVTAKHYLFYLCSKPIRVRQRDREKQIE